MDVKPTNQLTVQSRSSSTGHTGINQNRSGITQENKYHALLYWKVVVTLIAIKVNMNLSCDRFWVVSSSPNV